MTRTLCPVAVSSRNLDEQIQSMLRDDEVVQARADANGRFATLLERLPFVRHVLECVRGRFELVVTNRRFIAIRVSRLTRRVKSCRACPIHHMLTLRLHKGLLESDLRFQFADGRNYSFCRVSTPRAVEFLDQFPEGILAHALASTLTELTPQPVNRSVARIEYRTPAA